MTTATKTSSAAADDVDESLKKMEEALQPVLTEDLEVLLEGKTAIERCAGVQSVRRHCLGRRLGGAA